jgi:hypothetical protein
MIVASALVGACGVAVVVFMDPETLRVVSS